MKWLKTEEHSTKREFSPQLNSTPPPKKKIRNDGISTLPPPLSSSEYSSAATKMMEKMGYDKSRGLSLNAQGPTKIIEESKQKGRRGLGFTFKNFDDETTEWDFDNDPAPIEEEEEEVRWRPLNNHIEVPLNLDEMREWIKSSFYGNLM
ncbi:unnamed protein product [Rotaria sordida]|uniref:G-patch domain-containing protein n=1 Tax=Rotaria sordida TaxID=392033 RepID=A0A815J7M7_9BILA|nr:unnamed protein product [Rotaria sordida]